MRTRQAHWITLLALLASLLAAWAFLSPLTGPGSGSGTSPATPGGEPGAARSAEAPLLFLLLTALCAVVVLAGLETGDLSSRRLAMLGVLIGINAVLRLLPGPPGFSAVFFLPILTGYVVGADFGFLLGALSMAVSAGLTGGLGPWVPFQMLATGWIGLLPGWLPDLSRFRRLEVATLALWGAVAGFLFGLVINLWFWPVLDPTAAAGHGLDPGTTLGRNLQAYGLYYLATSVWWDAGRALGNGVLLIVVGPPVLRLLRRFEHRFRFRVTRADIEDGARHLL